LKNLLKARSSLRKMPRDNAYKKLNGSQHLESSPCTRTVTFPCPRVPWQSPSHTSQLSTQRHWKAAVLWRQSTLEGSARQN
jgi:hypothetical protein